MAFQAPFNPLALAEMNMQQQQQQAAQQQQAFDSISGALDNLLGTYVQHEEKKAKGRAMKNAFGVIAPSLGMDEATLKQLTGNLKSDNDWYNFGAEMGPMLPSLINANMSRNRLQQAGQMPYINAGIKNQQNIAGGNVPHGSGMPQSPAGMAPVEPPLPVGDENLPPVGGAPMAAPSTSVPGGQASIDAINRDRQRRGLPPIK